MVVDGDGADIVERTAAGTGCSQSNGSFPLGFDRQVQICQGFVDEVSDVVPYIDKSSVASFVFTYPKEILRA